MYVHPYFRQSHPPAAATAPPAAFHPAAPPELLSFPYTVSNIITSGWILEFKVSKRPY